MNSEPNTLFAPTENEALELVKSVLRENPQWLTEDAELSAMATRARGNVISLDAARLDHLQRQAETARQARESVIEIANANHDVQARVHSIVLAMMSARDLETACDRLAWTLPGALGVDYVKILIEDADAPDLPALGALEPGEVTAIMGASRRERLGLSGRGARALYGEEAERMRSEALLRMEIGGREALLVLGSRDSRTFREDHGCELLTFLARAIERSFGEWLPR